MPNAHEQNQKEPVLRCPHEDTSQQSHPCQHVRWKEETGEASCSSPHDVFRAFSQALSKVTIHIHLGQPAREKKQSVIRPPRRVLDTGRVTPHISKPLRRVLDSSMAGQLEEMVSKVHQDLSRLN